MMHEGSSLTGGQLAVHGTLCAAPYTFSIQVPIGVLAPTWVIHAVMQVPQKLLQQIHAHCAKHCSNLKLWRRAREWRTYPLEIGPHAPTPVMS